MKKLEWIEIFKAERKNMDLKEWLGKEEICPVTDLDYPIKKRAMADDEFAKIELLNIAMNDGTLRRRKTEIWIRNSKWVFYISIL